jgi:hypothetical protein
MFSTNADMAQPCGGFAACVNRRVFFSSVDLLRTVVAEATTSAKAQEEDPLLSRETPGFGQLELLNYQPILV